MLLPTKFSPLLSLCSPQCPLYHAPGPSKVVGMHGLPAICTNPPSRPSASQRTPLVSTSPRGRAGGCGRTASCLRRPRTRARWFRNEGACVPPYYRASPLHGGRVQGDLLKTRARACTSEDLQRNAIPSGYGGPAPQTCSPDLFGGSGLRFHRVWVRMPAG